MKNWFNKLEDKYKLFLIIALYVGSFAFVSVDLLCVACLTFAIIFTVFYVQGKKADTTQETPAPESISSNAPSQTAQPTKEIVSVLSFPTSDEDYILHREYKDDIALPQNLDKLKLNDTDIELVPEPDNQYDPYAVALYKGEHKLGYFYKGTIPYMVVNYLHREDYRIKTIVCLLDNENNKLAVKIAFYRKSNLIK